MTKHTSSGTTTDHYGDGSDSPLYASRVGSSGTTYSSYLQGLAGLGVTLTTQGGTSTVSLDLSDPSGSIAATVDLPSGSDASGLTSFGSTDEYGNPEGPAVSTAVLDYGWEGTAQREITNVGLTLMGARVYNPTTGRFTSPDPIVGGNENAYNYPNDPIDGDDTSGALYYLYQYTELIGSVSKYGGAVSAMNIFKADPHQVFPFPVAGCASWATGETCTLYAFGYGVAYSKGRVRVGTASTSVTFTVVGGGFFDRAGSYIKFSTFVKNGKLYLRQNALGIDTVWYIWVGVQAGAAKSTWEKQARRLAATIERYS